LFIYRPGGSGFAQQAFGRKCSFEADLIVVDEASMFDLYIWQDLLSYRVPIIAVGDHG